MPPSSKMSHMTFSCRSRCPPNQTQDVHVHVMQCPHQQQRMTGQKYCSPHHFYRGPRDTPRHQGNEWKYACRGNARTKIVCVESTCLPRVPTWRLWKTVFYVTSPKNMLKLAMFSHVYVAFFSCLTWRILGDVPENNSMSKRTRTTVFFDV